MSFGYMRRTFTSRTSLSRLCCRELIRFLTLEQDNFNELFVEQIFKTVPDSPPIKQYLWDCIVSNSSQLRLICAFVNSNVPCQDKSSEFLKDIILIQKTSTIESIIHTYLNTYKKYKGKLATCLRISSTFGSFQRLVHIPNLNALLISNTSDKLQFMEYNIRQWVSYLKMKPNHWKRLTVLCIEGMENVKLLFDLLLLLPSLKYIHVNISPAIMNSIPLLKNNVVEQGRSKLAKLISNATTLLALMNDEWEQCLPNMMDLQFNKGAEFCKKGHFYKVVGQVKSIKRTVPTDNDSNIKKYKVPRIKNISYNNRYGI